MKQSFSADIEKSLQDVPMGTMELNHHADAPEEPGLFNSHFHAGISGKGRMDIYRIFPGIQLSFNSFQAAQASFSHESDPYILEINHCRTGRIGWNLNCGSSIYLGPGDTSIHSAHCCADSVMLFPLGYCESVSVSINLRELSENCPPILREAGIDTERLFLSFCQSHTSHMLADSEEIRCIFLPLYHLPEKMRLPYFKLKTQELLLYLNRLDPKHTAVPRYQSQQTETVRKIHDQLTGHLDRRYTIEELSRQFLINSSTLKQVFKAVYGLPIATYMKEYRIHKAMDMLRRTDKSIAQIAEEVGYETQGKFTNAFKDCTQMTPSKYRKQIPSS